MPLAVGDLPAQVAALVERGDVVVAISRNPQRASAQLPRELRRKIDLLQRGQEIPQPGRWISLALRFEYK